MPLSEVIDLPAAELAVWSDWYALHGFPADREEWGRALAAEYVGAVWGGKVRASKLVPDLARAGEADDVCGVMAWFERVGKG